MNSEMKALIEFANKVVLKTPPLPMLKSDFAAPQFIRALDGHLTKAHLERTLMLPNFHEHVNTIAVFTDYAGDAADAKHLSYSFLFAPYDALSVCFAGMKSYREKHGLIDPYVEVNFKNLGYGPVSRIIDEWLALFDAFPALLFTLSVRKDIHSIVYENDRATLKEIVKILSNEGMGEWKTVAAERLVRVVHSIGYWCAMLSKPNQNILWITDHDQTVANPQMTQFASQLFQRVLNMYAPGRYGTIAVAKPFEIVNKDQDFFDILSIPDLSAGVISNLLSAIESPAPLVKEDTNRVLRWLTYQGIGLKKVFMNIRPEGGSIGTCLMDLKPITPLAGESISIIFPKNTTQNSLLGVDPKD